MVGVRVGLEVQVGAEVKVGISVSVGVRLGVGVAVRVGVGVREAKRPAMGSPAEQAPISAAARTTTQQGLKHLTTRRRSKPILHSPPPVGIVGGWSSAGKETSVTLPQGVPSAGPLDLRPHFARAGL